MSTASVAKRRGPIESGVPAWIAYDFINSILIINGSIYFSKWLVQEQHVNTFWYDFTYAASTILLLACLPLVGSILDLYLNGKLILLLSSVLMGVAACILPWLGNQQQYGYKIIGTLCMFGTINFMYQASFVPYNWLLTRLNGVNSQAEVASVSGLGEGAGSLGSVAGAVLGVQLLKITFLSRSLNAHIDIFYWLAVIFLILFAIDYWMLYLGMKLDQDSIPQESLRAIFRVSFELIRKPSKVRRFLFAFLLYADALLTVQLNIPIYMRERIGLDDAAVPNAIALALFAGFIGALFYSWKLSRINLKGVIIATLVVWVVTLILLGVTTSRIAFFILMSWSGVLYGVIWSVSRAYLIELAPSERLGRAFGSYAVFERCASVVGPLAWGAVMLLPLSLGTRYIFAFSTMSGLVLISAVLLLLKKGLISS